MSSQIGKNVKISVFGESHGQGIGAVIDGFPPGFPIDMEELAHFMSRRAPGQDKSTSPRKEADNPVILSGIRDGITCGTPIACVIENTNTRSQDYLEMNTIARPGHGDFTGQLRYKGNQDIRGGGHFSARLTAPLVFAGGLCKQYLEAQGIYIGAHLLRVKNAADDSFDPVHLTKIQLQGAGDRAFPVVNPEAEAKMREVIEAARLDGDSVGGLVEVAVIGLPGGLGSPIFETVEGLLSYGYFGIPGVKAVEFGAGMAVVELFGSENNDPFYMDKAGEGEKPKVKTRTNNHGGILGGITSGMPVIARLAFKPTPSIGKEQKSIDYIKQTDATLQVKGRHDPCIAVRAVPVVEAVTAMIIMDLFMEQL